MAKNEKINKKKPKKETGKKGSDTNNEKKQFKETHPDLVMVRSDDLRELVTETVTKLMAEDVLDMGEDGKIDLKEKVELKKKVAKKKKNKDD